MHRVLVFVHVASVLTFMLSHGASAAVALRLRKVTELHDVKALLDLSSSTFNIFYASFLALLVTGIWAGFTGDHWRHLWIWAALGLFIAIAAVMYAIASSHFTALRRASGLPYYAGRKTGQAEEPRAEEVAALLKSSRPIVASIIGFVGILLILWLMLYKPF